MDFVGFEMLIFVIVNNVAAGDGFGSFVVVLDVIGLQARVAIVQIDVAIGDIEVALALLLLGGEVRDAAFGGRQANLLGVERGRSDGEPGKKKQRQMGGQLTRENRSITKAIIQTEHAGGENSWIA